MDLLLPIAAKSFLVAGAVLLLLKLAQNRSASDRSWIAHLGLAAVLLLPVAAVALPALNVEGPSFLASTTIEPAAPVESVVATSATTMKSEAAPSAGTFPAEVGTATATAPVDWALWGYAAPAVVLLLLTLIALGRLFGLKGRANVMVEPHWLTALARAQRRMGFKHGTALLTSDELPSPISWGVMRPVILLNSEAAESHGEAEAIIAHELAHVASLDWAKLLLARITVAIFWFNPLVWVLAREAHQLREEAADDAVLGADIEDTEYAKLLVGVARHECRGLLIGAHGVAPAKNSLARRVRRVLDGALERAPGGWRWSTAAAFFAAGMAVPVAALNFVPTATASDLASEAKVAAKAAPVDYAKPYYSASTDEAPPVTKAISDAVASTVSGAVAAVHPGWSEDFERDIEKEVEKRLETKWSGKGPKPGTIGPKGRVGPHAAAIDRAIALKAVGATPQYIASIRAASPRLARVAAEDLVPLAAVGVTPAYIQELANAGYRHLDADELVEARALNVRGEFIRGMAAAGYRNLSIDQLGEMRAVGVTADFVERLHRAGFKRVSADKLVELKALGVRPEEIRNIDDDHDIDHDRDDGS